MTIMERLPLKQYAALLCEIIGKYDFPPITYDFAKNEEIRHGSMLAVEHYIGGLLHSECLEDAKDGLSKVLYWGHANNKLLQTSSLKKFREAPDADELKRKLDRFVRLARELARPSIVPPGGDLLKIKELGIPQFGRVSFVSKVLMFLDPARYPVLDQKIAEAYAKQLDFPPLQNLTFSGKGETIAITPQNAAVYDNWACWCREIAKVVNKALEPPRRVRAVDVERALFTLAQRGVTYDARLLLAGPVD